MIKLFKMITLENGLEVEKCRCREIRFCICKIMVALMNGGMERNERSGKAWGMFRGRQIGPCNQVDRDEKNEKSRITSIILIFTTTL